MEGTESTIKKLFGENVQKYRKKKELTQTELSEKIGVSQKHLSDIETGLKFPTASLIEKISQALDTPPSFLFGGSDEKALVIEISNKVSNLVMLNLQPKLQLIFNDLEEIKKKLNNMTFKIQTD